MKPVPLPSDRESVAPEHREPVAPGAAQQRRPRWTEGLGVYLRRPVLVVLLLGFSSGLPLALTGATLAWWMREAKVDLGTIGLFGLVGVPYIVKFLWAPLVDAVGVPVLSRLFGRRRGWLLLTQLLLMAAIAVLAMTDPVVSPALVALGAFLVATASATQDIVVDAFRIESLARDEQAAGQASYVAGYRIGMLASGAGALFLVTLFGGDPVTGTHGLGLSPHAAWMASYAMMAVLVAVGICASLLAREPRSSAAADAVRAHTSAARRVFGTALDAFMDFLRRHGGSGPELLELQAVRRVATSWHAATAAFARRDAAVVAGFAREVMAAAGAVAVRYRWVFAVLGFVVLFKFTDALAGVMTAPFVNDLGFSRDTYATIIKVFGLAASLAGGFAGGFVARFLPLSTSLWVGGLLQAFANLAFSWQAVVGADVGWLTFAITLENFTSGIGTVIFVAYLSALCRNPLLTATQYALLTALAAVGRTVLAVPGGFLAATVGWPVFFVLCAAAAIPGLVVLGVLQRRGHFAALEKPDDDAAPAAA